MMIMVTMDVVVCRCPSPRLAAAIPPNAPTVRSLRGIAMQKFGVSPDAFAQLAMQLAYRRLTGRPKPRAGVFVREAPCPLPPAPCSLLLLMESVQGRVIDHDAQGFIERGHCVYDQVDRAGRTSPS